MFILRSNVVMGFILTLLLSSTATAGAPDWVNGEALSYPNVSYIIASGSASDAETAKDRALSNLAKVFELHIRESSTTTQNVQTTRSGSEETSAHTSVDFSQQITTSTDKIIDGARVAEQWRNSEDLTYFALAVLDRKQAGNNIRQQINKLDSEVSFDLNKAEKSNDPLTQVATYQVILNKQLERNALQKTLKIIDLSGRGSAPSLNDAELRDKLEKSLKSLDMRAVILADSVGGLEKVLKGAMSKAGFPAKAGNGYALSASLETQPPFAAQGWNWLRGTLTLRLEGPDGKVRGNKIWPLKVSAVQAPQLEARMKSAAQKKLNQELKATILDFATIK